MNSNKISSRDGLFFENQIAKKWLSTDEAARFLSLSPNALRILVFRNRVKAYKLGHRLRFRLKDLNSLLINKGELNVR